MIAYFQQHYVQGYHLTMQDTGGNVLLGVPTTMPLLCLVLPYIDDCSSYSCGESRMVLINNFLEPHI